MRGISGTLVAIVLLLLSLGLVMLYSTSGVKGDTEFNNPDYFLQRQLMWLIVAFIGVTFISTLDYHFWQKPWVLNALLAGTLLALVLVFMPVIGVKVKGSHRWIGALGMSFQPSELAKFSLIVWLSAVLVKRGRTIQYFKEGLMVPLIGFCSLVGLVALEPDIGTTALMAAVGAALLFVAGARILHLVRLGFYGSVPLAAYVLTNDVRMGRIMAWFNPEAFPQASYHVTQSKLAFISGGAFGVGLGNSMQKQLYLPEAHTDFILAIIGEELGLVATCFVALLFLGILICGLLISRRAQDPFGQYLAFGFTLILCLQAALNIGVVTDCLPTKGIALPFISYGGSSLVFSLASIGMLLNIVAHSKEKGGDEHVKSIKDRLHRF